MAAAETARLIASLELKDLFTKQLGSAEKQLGSFDKKLDGTQGRAYKAGTQIGTGIKRSAALAVGAIGFLTATVALGINSIEKLESVTAQTNAVIKSTKGVSGETSQAILDLANKYENLNATMDDTAIQSGANVLLTFTNIRKKAFEPALLAALDLSTAMKQDLQSSVVQLGKALNDPVKGLTSLTRVGVTFTKGQKDQIAAAVKAGDTLKAQKIILAELNKEFGGSFLAGGQTTTGKVAKFKDAIDDLQRTLATALLPVIGKVADALSRFLADPAVVKGANDIGKAIAGLFSDENLKAGADTLKGLFETAKSVAPIVATAAKTTFGFVQAAVGLFKSLPPELQGLLVGGFAINKLTGGLVTNIGGALIDLIGKSRGGSPANPVWVATAQGGVPGVGGAAGGGGSSVLSKGLSIAAIVASVAAVIEVQQQQTGQSQAIATGVSDAIKNQIAGGASLADLQRSLAAVDQGIAELQSNPLSVLVRGDALDQLIAQNKNLRDAIAAQQKTAGAILDRGGRFDAPGIVGGGKENDDLIAVLRLHQTALRDAIAALTAAKKPPDIAAAVKRIVDQVVTKGRGSVEGTKSTISALKSALERTHDPKLQAAIRSALSQVEKKLPAREFAARQLSKLDGMLRDGKLSRSEQAAAKRAIQQLNSRGLPHTAAQITARIDAAKRAQVAASQRAGQVAAAAIRDKEWRLTTIVRNNISIRELANGQTVVTNYSDSNLRPGTRG